MAGPKDEIESTRIICEGGLNTNESVLILSQDSPGAATALVNYESAISGGYRRINGYLPYDADFAEVGVGVAEGPVLWVAFFFNTTTGLDELYAARADIGLTAYSIYKYDGTLGWVAETLPATRDMSSLTALVSKLRYAEFNFGSGNHMIVVDGVNPALWFDGTTWRELLSSNTGASDASPGGNQIIDAPSVVAIFKRHIFLSGDMSANGQARVAHSSPLSPIDWTSASGAGQMFPSFQPVQIKPWRDELYVFGKRSIKKAIADLASGFVLQDVTDDLGCLAADSVLEIGGSLIFLSQDGIRPVAGTDKISDVELGLLSQNVQPTIDSLIEDANFTNFDGVVIRAKTQFRYTWGDPLVDQAEAKGLIGCLRTNKRTGRAWEWGELLGVRTSCVWSGLVADREVVLHGDYNGFVYQDEIGNSFDGANILSIYSTPFLDMGATDIRKSLRELNTFVSVEGLATIFIGLAFDWDMDTRILVPDNYQQLISSGNSIYDDLTTIWDNSATLYGSDVRAIMNTKLQGSCFSVKFSFVNQGTDAPYVIQGIIPEYTVRGRN